MEDELIFRHSAFKHGIEELDIRNAFKQRMFDHTLSGDNN